MGKAHALKIDSRQAQAFLAEQFDPSSTAVKPIGEGAWSRCFGFRRNDEELAVRFGLYLDDFMKDQRAYAYATPDLPIPKVHKIGRAFGGYYAVSTRVHGIALEFLTARQWQQAVPSVAAALEAMRTADLSATTGYGEWGGDGNAPLASWSERLLSVALDTPKQRNYGWRNKLARSEKGEVAFAKGYERLKQLADVPVPRNLIHGDLINRNVYVKTSADGADISGVFDWGCSCYGDHLYDLAWFEFWAPWHPELDDSLLRHELERRWRAVHYVPDEVENRLQACYLHIGLDHLAYNAWLENWTVLSQTAQRMEVLVNGMGP